MEPHFTIAYARRIQKLREQEIELMLNLARFVAGARVQGAVEEVRG